ncbi:MAG TPA: cysteine desulfurase [Coleofasciculaceae cyanobacterium]|jgi:cysteine desulfurase/selenocysteine lyase
MSQQTVLEKQMDTSPLSAAEARKLREDFPVLKQLVYGKPLVYLDNAATTQKPQVVIDRITNYFSHENGTVRRGVYKLSEQSTLAFDEARRKVARFINAESPSECIFVRGTTEAINLVAATFGRANLQAGDEVIISAIEHHANIVPWQQVCAEKGAKLKVVPVNDAGELDLEAFDQLLTERTKLVAIVHISNALGTVNPVKTVIDKAHALGVPVLVDGAQSAPHMPIDVQALDCDFYAFSGHKLYGPTGVGVLYGKMKHLEAMPPYQCGGDMIQSVTFEKTTFAKPPNKFEAGTPAIAEVIGLGAAIDYLENIGLARIGAYEHELLTYATARMGEIPEVKIIGTAQDKAGILSFTVKGAHPHDIGTILDREGVAIRAGHHCAQPVMERYGVPATARASFSFYNTTEDIDRLVEAVRVVIQLFG